MIMPILLPPTHTTLGFIQNIGWMELVIIFAVLLLVFGRRLPEVGKNIGRGITEFKRGLREAETASDEAAARPAQPYTMTPGQAPGALPPPATGQQAHPYAQQPYAQQPYAPPPSPFPPPASQSGTGPAPGHAAQ
jgi:sec-independent protein translocase protein TatA